MTARRFLSELVLPSGWMTDDLHSCTGVAFNVLTNNEQSLADYEPMLQTLASWRPFYDQAVRAMGRRPCVGVHPLWEPTEGDYPAPNSIHWQMPGIAEAGIPIAYARGNSCVFLLSRSYLEKDVSREQIRELLKAGVYTDNDALGRLNEPGRLELNQLTGMEYGGTVSVDGILQFTNHPLNASFAAEKQDNRQSFWRVPVVLLKKTQPGVETLTRLVNYQGEQTGETVVGLFQNELGGRICINGSWPWSHFHSRATQAQLRRIMRWLSRDTLPAYVESFGLHPLWVRQPDASGRFALLVLNANYDSAKALTLCLRTDKTAVVVWEPETNQKTLVRSVSSDGPYQRFVLPPVGPWNAVLVETIDAPRN